MVRSYVRRNLGHLRDFFTRTTMYPPTTFHLQLQFYVHVHAQLTVIMIMFKFFVAEDSKKTRDTKEKIYERADIIINIFQLIALIMM